MLGERDFQMGTALVFDGRTEDAVMVVARPPPQGEAVALSGRGLVAGAATVSASR